ADIEAAVTTLRFPIIAKPGDRGVESRHTFKTRAFSDVEELRAEFAQDAAFGRGLLFQRYQSGDGVGVEILMRNGLPVAHFQHRRLAELPASGGVCVYGVSETADPMLLEYAVRLLKELEWDGVAMVEFRHDRQTNETGLLEVNGRFWGSIALPVMSGVDFPSLAWQAAQGREPITPVSYRVGVQFRWTAGALMRFALAFGPEQSEGFSRSRAMKELLTQLRPGIRSALWDRDDPQPARQEVADVLRGWIKSWIKSGISAVVPKQVLATVKTARNLPAGRGSHYLRRRFARALDLAPRQRLPSTITSVVFVCHGNIMRSVAAGQLLLDALASAGITDVVVESAGAHTRVGSLADARVNDAVLAYGTSLEQHRSQPLTRELVDGSDVVFVMDDMNYVDVTAEYPGARAKVRMLRGVEAMSEDGGYAEAEIPDPYGRSTEAVRSTIANVHESVLAVARAIVRTRSSVTQRRVGSQTAAR
ncbi:MAG: ATP-grasp domain-containing protein, partial [Gemmatimonadaceae bacterium]